MLITPVAQKCGVGKVTHIAERTWKVCSRCFSPFSDAHYCSTTFVQPCTSTPSVDHRDRKMASPGSSQQIANLVDSAATFRHKMYI